MKFLLFFAALGCVWFASIQAISTEQKEAYEKVLFADCKKQENATDEEVASIAAREVPTTRTTKCLAACIQEKLGVLQNGKGSPEHALMVAKTVHSDDENALKIAIEIIKECSLIFDSDRCEMAGKYVKCGHDEAVKRKVDPKKMI